jgi:hypothetical protein
MQAAGRKARRQVCIWNWWLARKPVGQAGGWTLEGMECRHGDPDSTSTENWNLTIACPAACLPALNLPHGYQFHRSYHRKFAFILHMSFHLSLVHDIS